MSGNYGMKRGIYNVLAGFLNQIITIALGILVPRLVLVSFGSEVNGLVNSITQIFVYFSLLEAGVGAATLQALYGPVARDDKASINEILAATSRYYKKTGIVYFFAVLGLAVVYPLVVSTDIPPMTIILVILLQGMVGVANYFFQGKFRYLLEAEGKNYIITNLTTMVTILTNVAKIILLLLGADIVIVQASYMVFNLLQMLFIAVYIHRRYKWLNLKVQPNYGAISQKNNALIHQFSNLIFNNTDVLILTVVCGLKVASVYSMYTLFFNMINTMLSTASSGVVFTLGQRFNVDREGYTKLFDCYESYYLSLVFTLFAVTYIFILPFMKLYTAGITDINYIDQYLPMLFVAMNLLSAGRGPSNNTINIAGHFKQTQWRSILETAINVSVSLVCVYFYGIYGVLFGTIAALLYRANDMIIYSNRVILKRSPKKTYRRWGIDLVLLLIILFVSSQIHLALDTYGQIILWAAIYLIIIAGIFFGVTSLTERESAKMIGSLFRPLWQKLFHRGDR